MAEGTNGRLPTVVIVAEARLHGWHHMADMIETAESEAAVDELVAAYHRLATGLS